jgi:hypothetical protein
MAPALLADEGAPIKIVLGYVSTARIILALEQGEVDASFSVGNALASRPDLFKRLVPIVQTGANWPSVPRLADLVRADHRPIVDLVTASDAIGVPLVGPAGMPHEVTQILRQAFVTMAADKDYQADAEKVELPIGNPIGGAEVAGKIAALASIATPQVIREFNRLAGSR